MESSGSIEVIKAIVHVLDKENKTKTLSDYELDVDKRLEALIVNHILAAFRHESRIFAKFSGSDNKVKKSCVEILDNDDKFIIESKGIADELYKAMSGTNASSANLLVCKYKHGENRLVAIIKLDFSENFYTENINENGKIKVVVKINGNGFNRNQKLRKCSIVHDDIISNDESEILVLDTQNSNEVSNYFRVGFLNCELINDEKVNTNNIIKEMGAYINEVYNKNPKDMMIKTYEFTNILEKSDEFKIDDVLIKLFDDETTRDKFKDKLASKNIDYQFKISKPVVEKRLKNRTVVTDNGISLRAKAALFNSNDIEIEEKEDGLSNIIIHNVRINKNKI